MKGKDNNSFKEKAPAKGARYDGRALNAAIERLPGGAPKMAALLDAIRQADQAQDHRWRLWFRYDYACEATFRDDPPKCMPVVAEFQAIFEEHPDALGPDGHQAYLMIMQMGIDPIVGLPQIPLAQWEKLMEQYLGLTKRFNMARRTYWWQMCQFMIYVDFDKAYQYFQKFWKSGRDAISDCRACERSNAVRLSLLAGDREGAEEYAAPLKAGRVSFCADTPQKMWLAYLEDDYRRGDYAAAAPMAESLYRKGNKDRSNLDYVGAVLQCWAHTDLDRAVALCESCLVWSLGMWDQRLVYLFDKGAWLTFRELAKGMETVKLELPKEFPLWKEDGSYSTRALAEHFYSQAEEIARRFDLRNGSGWYRTDLELAGREPVTMPG